MRMSFNSLFEIRGGTAGGYLILIIMPFNSLFEIHYCGGHILMSEVKIFFQFSFWDSGEAIRRERDQRGRLIFQFSFWDSWDSGIGFDELDDLLICRGLAFNSLFEIRLGGDPHGRLHKWYRLSILFLRFHGTRRGQGVRRRNPLSILFLRFFPHEDGHRRNRFRVFQFSFWDSPMPSIAPRGSWRIRWTFNSLFEIRHNELRRGA